MLFIKANISKMFVFHALYSPKRPEDTCPQRRFLHNRVSNDESINC
ncbi:hypothetical protein G3D70_001780 [Escherichia coli]|nr:hypothetical protein [Escherichia coli]EFI8834794.1 hypothetical protein [Escherichia coli]HAH4683954.1 hypothetical protein [Escherichia coli]HAH4980212.1 hypothetical protein [Escherichia coli]HAH5901234.1 hypothetical protein [Escherichia coli]